jgi:hypothetical protein
MKWSSCGFLGVQLSQTFLVLAWLWLKSAKLLTSDDSDNRSLHINNQPHRAFITWQHHSLDPYGGNAMVQQWSFSGYIQPWIWFGLALAEICQSFGQQQCHPKSATQSLHIVWLSPNQPMVQGLVVFSNDWFVCSHCSVPM